MNLKTLLASSLLIALPAFAAATKSDADLIAEARAAYPLKTCLVSDEPLGSMGEATPFIHRPAGQSPRVVFFCCEGCSDDFKADPAKFLKKLDNAKSGKSAPKADAKHGKKHQH